MSNLDQRLREIEERLKLDWSGLAKTRDDLALLLDLVRVYREALKHSSESFKMWRKYSSPGNIAEAESTIYEALARGEALTGKGE